LELLAEKQVLHDEALTAADGGDEGGQDEPDEFEHRGRIADPMWPKIAKRPFAPLQGAEFVGWRPLNRRSGFRPRPSAL